MSRLNLVHRLLWLAVLSYVLPPIHTQLASDCDTEKSAIEGTCTAVTTVAGIAGGVLCVSIPIVGCLALVGTAAITATCASGAFKSCDSSAVGAEHREIVEYLVNMQSVMASLEATVNIRFFEVKYIGAMQKIMVAGDKYEDDVILNTGSNGMVTPNARTRRWRDGVLGTLYDLSGSLILIEYMISGQDYTTPHPSVYELTDRENMCTKELYEYVSTLLIKGTALWFIALEMEGTRIQKTDKVQLDERLELNSVMYQEFCQWKEVRKDVDFPYLMRNNPVQVKTDSVVGSGEYFIVNFYMNNQKSIYDWNNRIQVAISFKYRPTYYIHYCTASNERELSAPLPSDERKVWTITVLPDGLKIHCNDQEVAYHQFSATAGSRCRRAGMTGATRWMRFTKSGADAADYYRAKPMVWRKFTPERYVDYHLEAHPLQIKTDSRTGSGAYLFLFFQGGGYLERVFGIKFSRPPKYYIRGCPGSYHPFPVALPDAVDKVWTITKLADGLKIHCNGVEVLDYKFPGSCKRHWTLKTSYIQFPEWAPISPNYMYRAKPGLLITHPAYE